LAIENISDTAHLTAHVRERESARPDALLHDVDLPHVLEFKAGVIGRERARCEYESLPDHSCWAWCGDVGSAAAVDSSNYAQATIEVRHKGVSVP